MPPPPYSSYNSVNGVPSCANDWLLGTLLRDSWQFNGYVTSDCDADSDVFNTHHYTATPEEAVKVILAAGTDVDCGGFMTQHAQSALDKGLIAESDIDTVLRRLFMVRIRLGFFDPPSALDNIGPESVCNDYALELARDGVRQSTVLVKNDGGLLPLKASSYSNVVVIGPNMDYTGWTNYCEHRNRSSSSSSSSRAKCACGCALAIPAARPTPAAPPPNPSSHRRRQPDVRQQQRGRAGRNQAAHCRRDGHQGRAQRGQRRRERRAGRRRRRRRSRPGCAGHRLQSGPGG